MTSATRRARWWTRRSCRRPARSRTTRQRHLLARPGDGFGLLRTHNLTFDGDFPLNTNGGQLGFGRADGAGGLTHVVEDYRQVAGRADRRQIAGCDTMFVSGNGGIMSEQGALILVGANR